MFVVDSPQAPVRSPGVYDNDAPPGAHGLVCGFECDSLRPYNLAGVYMTSPRPCLIKMLQPHTFALVALDVGLGIIIRLRRMWACDREARYTGFLVGLLSHASTPAGGMRMGCSPRLPCGRPGFTMTARLPALIVCGFKCDSLRPYNLAGVYI